jgi:hypothetical protein
MCFFLIGQELASLNHLVSLFFNLKLVFLLSTRVYTVIKYLESASLCLRLQEHQ